MYSLRCAVQNYHWGCRGEKSIVAQLKKAEDPSYIISSDQHYAEYWFGTHASGPSEILIEGVYQPLKSFIENHPECLGSSMGKTKLELPFLTKVLSVETALSIQAHPDKKLAEILFKTKPELYKDDNHKPEMAYALSPFTAMCGFRKADEIVGFLQSCPYLRRIIGESVCSGFERIVRDGGDLKEGLRSLFTAYIEAEGEAVQTEIQGMKEYLRNKAQLSFLEGWIQRLMETYPTDTGVFAPYLLNVITMKSGDSIYMGADIPHAYLEGEIVESMACSNNVVRAGLTPKTIDKETLVSMLTYECGDVVIYHALSQDEHYSIIETPAVEFMLEILSVKKGEQYAIPKSTVPRILIVYNGCGQLGALPVKYGSIVFQEANNESIMKAEEDMTIYATHERL